MQVSHKIARLHTRDATKPGGILHLHHIGMNSAQLRVCFIPQKSKIVFFTVLAEVSNVATKAAAKQTEELVRSTDGQTHRQSSTRQRRSVRPTGRQDRNSTPRGRRVSHRGGLRPMLTACGRDSNYTENERPASLSRVSC